MFLIDTMVLSDLSKPKPDPGVMIWMEGARYEPVCVSVVTIGEIERGIHKLEMREGRPADRQRVWLDRTLAEYGTRVLPISIDVARRWGRLSHDLKNVNPDLLIAATALEHGLTVVTRNVRHFAPTGAKVLNPYET